VTHDELDARKRELQRKRQKLVDAGKSTVLLDRLISKTQRAMNALAKEPSECESYG
jgi:hypothetical protein